MNQWVIYAAVAYALLLLTVSFAAFHAGLRCGASTTIILGIDDDERQKWNQCSYEEKVASLSLLHLIWSYYYWWNRDDQFLSSTIQKIENEEIYTKASGGYDIS